MTVVGRKYAVLDGEALYGNAEAAPDRRAVIVEVSGGKEVGSYRSPKRDRGVYRAYVYENYVIFILNSRSDGPVQVVRYEIPTGNTTDLGLVAGITPHALEFSTTVVAGQVVIAGTKPGKTGHCFVSIGIATTKVEDRGCLPSSERVTFVEPADNAFTYMSFLAGKSVADCRNRRKVSLADNTVTDIGRGNCRVWNATTVGNWHIWGEIPPGANSGHRFEDSVLYAQQGHGPVRELGTFATGSLFSCGMSAYFARKEPGREPRTEQEAAQLAGGTSRKTVVYRWIPGSPNLDVSYVAQRLDLGELNGIRCTEGIVTVNRMTWTFDNPSYSGAEFAWFEG